MHFDVTLEWMNKHGIPFTEMIFTEGRSKGGICGEKKIDVFIEDSIKNAVEIAERGTKVLLYSTDYNTALNRADIIRCSGWKNIVDTVRGIGNIA